MNIDKNLIAGLLQALISDDGDQPEITAAPGRIDRTRQYVIVRCRDAGVHAGGLVYRNGQECTLHSARRLWYWNNKPGHFTLSGVAMHGLADDSKVSCSVSSIDLMGVIEIIATTETAKDSITSIKAHTP